MVELVIMAVFAAALIVCIFADVSIVAALVFGWLLFAGYGLYKKQPLKRILAESASGIRTVKNILITFVLIGIITAVWRASGTIAFIVYYATELCQPSVMVLAVFLLCALLSVLTGTSFGTAATMGVICVTMADSMGINPVLSGGAMLAGSFFGDRCSPMSTSALLVSEVTGTSIYTNIKNMVRTGAVPAVISCVIYLAAGFLCESRPGTADIRSIFGEHFDLSVPVVLPAVIIVVLALLRINVKLTMSASILCGAVICLTCQNMASQDLLLTALAGFHPADEELAALFSGGGITSMIRVSAIVCISSSYAGIFDGTGYLEGIKAAVGKFCEKTSAFTGMVMTSLIASMISCNQTLAIMLTQQVCSSAVKDPDEMAVNLEDSAVVIAALIPWSIACAVPLDTVGAPDASIFAACFLYLLPLWRMICSRRKAWNRRKNMRQA